MMANPNVGLRQRRLRQAGAPPATVLGSTTLRLFPATAYAVRYTPAAPVIGFAFDMQDGMHAFASDRLRPFRTRPNSIAYTPAGCDVASRSPNGGEYLVIELTGLQSGWPDRQFTDRIKPDAIAAAQNLRRHLLSESPTDTLDVEREVTEFCDTVIKPNNQAQSTNSEKWMTPRRLKLIGEIIEAELGKRLSVETLAGRLGLSSGCLTRACKAAIGVTPHDYIIDRRLARARALIAKADASLADIALACGFSSQAHLTTQMRRRLGVTPGWLRRSR